MKTPNDFDSAFHVIEGGVPTHAVLPEDLAAARSAMGTWKRARATAASVDFERIDRATYDAIAAQAEAGTLDWSTLVTT